MDNRETWLAKTLVELADTSVADFDDSTYACTLVTRLAELLDPAEIGLIIAVETDTPRVAAASSERMRELLALELKFDEGPCVASYRSGKRILGNSILGDDNGTVDQRWPRFAEVARSAGSRLASALPMRRHSDTIGAVGILEACGQSLSESELDLAQLLAEAATVGLRQHRSLLLSTRTSEQLQRALDSRVVIEQAKGMVAAWLGITPSSAFELLRNHARRHNRLLVDVANEAIHRKLFVATLMTTPKTNHLDTD